VWEALGAGKVVLGWLRYGYRMPFEREVRPFYHKSLPPSSPEETVYLALLEQRLLAAGAIRPAECRDFVSKSRLVPKKDGGFRLVVDLRHINEHFKVKPCKFETLRTLENLVRPGNWFFSVDLKDGYYHVGVHPSYQRYVTTTINGSMYHFVGLPFGLQTAPYLFTKVMRVFVKAVRREGIRVLPYLDDFLFVAASQDEALRNRKFVGDLLMSLGLSRNESKGMWVPAQVVIHLGIGVDSVHNLFFVPEDKLAVLKRAAVSLLAYAKSHRRWVHHGRLESFVGLAMSLTLALRQVKTYTRSLYDALSTRANRLADCRLSGQSMADLQWFADLDQSWNGLTIVPHPPSVVLTTDASDFGWGAHVPQVQPARGFFDASQRLKHITFKELLAVKLALGCFPEQLRHRTVHLRTDNQVVMSVVAKGASRSRDLMPLCRDIQAICRVLDVSWLVSYIPSEDNILADALSRECDPADWTISERIVIQIRDRFGLAVVDRFATSTNKLLPRYNSRLRDPASLGDAFLCSWAGALGWCNPPWGLLARVLSKSVEERAPIILMAPYWETAPWWPVLVHHASILWKIPESPSTFVIGTNPATPQPLRNPAWRMCVARLF